jgi:acetyltransferase-like isoleucine patch superfamily enzyme
LQVLKPETKISIGNNIGINNNLTIICTSTSVTIGSNVFVGHDVEILDSDVHAIDPVLRKENALYTSSSITISENVFIGNCMKILYGVQIGKNTFLANSSLVGGELFKY